MKLSLFTLTCTLAVSSVNAALSAFEIPHNYSLPKNSEEDILTRLPKGFNRIDVDSDGTKLKSILFDPKPTSKNGKNPAIIFISSWGMNKWEYVAPANEYAKKGYTVFSYTARGFWESEGEISLAGVPDQDDVKNMISWVIENTNADPERIGLSGISYGGGLSLLGAAVDSRVKSAVSMSCWVDIAESFLGNGETIRVEGVKMLQVLGDLVGNPSDVLDQMFDDYLANTNLDFLVEYTYNSSAIHFVDAINEHNTAVFIANALGDSLFTPNQFIDFFNTDLTVSSKHLEFAPGDHAGPEMGGLFGLPNQVWTRAMEWNDFYLLENHPNTEDIHSNEVHADTMSLVTFNTMDGKEVELYDSWAEVTTAHVVYDLSAAESLSSSSSSAGTSTGTGEVVASLTTGDGCGVTGGIAFISATVQGIIDVQKPFKMDKIDRKRAAVFVTDVGAENDVKYRGLPQLDLNITPQSAEGSLVIYLLAVDAHNHGHLFSFSPWTFKEAVPGEELSLSIPVTLTSYDMPAGYSLAVVVASQDSPLYLDENPADLTIQFMGGSKLSMPIHEEKKEM